MHYTLSSRFNKQTPFPSIVQDVSDFARQIKFSCFRSDNINFILYIKEEKVKNSVLHTSFPIQFYSRSYMSVSDNPHSKICNLFSFYILNFLLFNSVGLFSFLSFFYFVFENLTFFSQGLFAFYCLI